MKKQLLVFLCSMGLSFLALGAAQECVNGIAKVDAQGCPQKKDALGYARCHALLKCIGKVCLGQGVVKDQQEIKEHVGACLSKKTVLPCENQSTYCLIADLSNNTVSIGNNMVVCGKHACSSRNCIVVDLCRSKYAVVAYRRQLTQLH